MRRLRALVVDDSAFMRSAVARLVEADERFEVVGQARDGEEAVALARSLRPDVISMDFNMPKLNGAEATRQIVRERGVGVVMLSAHTREGATETLAALRAGAVDYVPKPGGEVSAHIGQIREELLSKLYAAARANRAAIQRGVERLDGAGERSTTPGEHPSAERASGAGERPSSAIGHASGERRFAAGERASAFGERSSVERASAAGRPSSPSASPLPSGLRVIVIASSTGGPAALAQVVPALDLTRSALLVVQHMAGGFTRALADQLSRAAPFSVREAQGGEQLREGVCLVAAGDSHLQVERGGLVRLTLSPPIHGVRPAADVTLRSVAAVYGPRAIGVVLTGMGRDGALGLAAVKAAGGRSLAQSEASSVVYGMPRAAVELGVVDEVVDLERVAAAICRLVS
ncbi:MAG: chemotaxis-specific protein-glutamate methyltransferase CheB [Polyangiaceae bacterium]|nr:chemotaxis-specific protein-glutamate methyltransferase CheB [Polyangiaceae bacterium]MCW5789279.1 chemotaxis-specific protein-glutamate methyltransferase CheB [Polyangiaceae bacterium]